MGALGAVGSGVAGAVALTALHESARRVVPDAPRMDVLGMQALGKVSRAAGVEPPHGQRLHDAALVGDLVSNALYYSLVGLSAPRNALLCGAALGLTAGLGAVLLPGPLGLATGPARRTPRTAAMTVAWYLAAGAIHRLLARDAG